MANSIILIIDRNRAEAQFIGFQLKEWGHSVVFALTVKEGINSVIHELPDLVVMESGGQEGLDFCLLMRQYTDLPIIVLGENRQKNEELKFLEAGADDFLPKPFSTEILSLKIRVILRRRSQVTELDSIHARLQSGLLSR